MNARNITSILATVFACLALSSSAWAELNAYAKIVADKGTIQGSVTQKGREGSIQVIAIEHSVQTSIDAASGQATGKRQHRAFVITKMVDKSSPRLHQAQANNENLKEITLDFWQPSAKSGAEAVYYRVTLTNAHISSIRHVMLNNQDAALSRFAASEEVAFTYQSITWTWVDGGLTASDDSNDKN